MSSTGDQIRRISKNLNWFYADTQTRAKLGRFDLHKDAERVFGTVLSKVLGYELEDLNRKKYNHPAVDFGNKQVQMAIQITATVSDQKIQHTLDTFLKHGLDEWYDHLMVMVIAPDVGNLVAPTPPAHIHFTKADIWDLPKLVAEIEALEDSQIAWIDRYLQMQMRGLQFEEIPQAERKKHRLIETRYLSRYINEKVGSHLKKDLYLPNRFRVDSQHQIFDDITKPISAFMSGTLKAWMEENKIVLHEQAGQAEEKIERDPGDISTLVIQGEQCTGKSTLVAQIIHSIDMGLLPFRNTYLLSFSERDLRSNSMSCRSICDHLRIQEEDLNDNALLLIDAIDESGWFQQKANSTIAELINEIRVLDCRIIITSRSGYLDIKDEHLLELQLCRFSEKQALLWVQKYQQAFPEKDTKNLEQYVHNLIDLTYRNEKAEKEKNDRSRGLRVDERFPAKPLTQDEKNLLQTADVILMPHIMELCIHHKVAITSISSMAQLYTQIFLPKTSGNLLYNRYSISPNNAAAINESKLHDAATKIAIQCLCKPEEGISYGTLGECINDPILAPVVCTTYLLTKIEEKYYFVHQSIPAFLVAWCFYERFSDSGDQSTDAAVMAWLWRIVDGKDVLTESVQDFIRFFAQRDDNKIATRIFELLCKLLDFEVYGTVTANTPLLELEKQRKILCDNLVRLYAAFITQNYDRLKGVKFFEEFKKPERIKQLLFLLSDSETRASKSMGFCRLQESELDGLNLSGADIHRRYIKKMQMRGSRLCETDLTDAYVVECDLSLSCLDRVSSKVVQYHNSVLCGCSFRNANLNGAVFTNCNLANADIRGARVFKTKFENCILGGMKVDIAQLKELLYMDRYYIWQNRIQVYLGNELLTGERFIEEYKRVRPIRSISVPNHSV